MDVWDATPHLTCPQVHDFHADRSVPFHGGWQEEGMLSRRIWLPKWGLCMNKIRSTFLC